MHKKFTKFIIYTTILLLILSQVTSLWRVRDFKNGKRSKFEILDFIGRVEEQGRRVERHSVSTDDGYTLTLFRIPPHSLLHNKSCSGPPILVQHSTANSAEMFLTLNPARSLAYTLSDAGYDVWLGNTRGTVYSKKHKTLSPDQSEFWDFSLDEPALKDVPSMLDYVLQTTGKSKLSYIGYSLGSTLSVILLSNRTNYNDKINLVVHFSHVSLQIYPSLATTVLATVGEWLRSVMPDSAFSVFKNIELYYFLTKYLCGSNFLIHEICTYSHNLIYGPPYEKIDFGSEEFLSSLLHLSPETSVKLLLHYSQHMRTREFRYYDHKDDTANLRYYGLTQPPYYNISNIAVPHVVFQGTNDRLVVPENVPVFISKLPPTTTVILEPIKNFNHNDLVTAKDVQTLVYNKLLLILAKFNKNN